MSENITVSLESHLLETLKPLLPLLPSDLREELEPELSKSEITYSVLNRISRWSRTTDGVRSIEDSRLDAKDYTIIALLAGSTTSPRSKLPPYVPPETSEEVSRREWSDRKALVAVVNGLLSVVCCGGAAWWTAEKQGWHDEWKVLLAFIVATVVGLSEVVLLMIWQSKAAKPLEPKTLRRKVIQTAIRDKKDGEKTENASEMKTDSMDEVPHRNNENLRRRNLGILPARGENI